MRTRTEQHGHIEVGIIEHQGREFKALGSVITDTHITAYLGQDRKLTKWDGTVIGTYRLASSWRRFSYVSSHLYQVYALVNGRTYTGRSAGVGMVFNGKLVASRAKRGN